jgi:hypothetical protein
MNHQSATSYVVSVGFDAASGRYYVDSSDIPGLNIETARFEELVEIARDVASELLGDQAAGSKISFRRDVVLPV